MAKARQALTPTDVQGRPYAPGQRIAYPYLSGCSPRLLERTVVAVEQGVVIATPTFGGSRPQVVRKPQHSLIIS